ncbi:sugar phosphate isomerase/epimerase [Bradyrhizobium sp. CB82]|uniref:sugar phosphate isomerase/epimerase family protein n=1 Tax=Bradyrhizobium sp. CB82 TaxID=3039159 RepID=UPI0024B122F3|nr:sugar phosphate isomerase/epimerase family protein [Bradyrhizobium sp. CB82]WFU38852.1 sugar phosphate isomerase/epimerase [Bradyrhizobium sp. CB82]
MTEQQLSVSNIAWPPGQHDSAVALLLSLGVRGIEIAPFNFFRTWEIDDKLLRDFKARLDDAGMICPAVQGIMFNVPSAHLFASTEARSVLQKHLVKIAKVAGVLRARACVFGAPKLRDPGALESDEAFQIAVELFSSLAPAFASEGTALSFEPNAAVYACRFVTTTSEAIDLVAAVNHPGVRLQIDTGTIFLERENPSVLTRAVEFAVHAHISEPGLAPVGQSGLDHSPLAKALADGGYNGSISIEMKSSSNWQENVKRAIAFAREHY